MFVFIIIKNTIFNSDYLKFIQFIRKKIFIKNSVYSNTPIPSDSILHAIAINLIYSFMAYKHDFNRSIIFKIHRKKFWFPLWIFFDYLSNKY